MAFNPLAVEKSSQEIMMTQLTWAEKDQDSFEQEATAKAAQVSGVTQGAWLI